jgi:hypothetical protein
MLSQDVVQQNGSKAQTQASIAASEQPGEECTVQQSCAGPQSAGQVAEVSDP